MKYSLFLNGLPSQHLTPYQFEKQGIGKQLHDIMLDWYFDLTKEKVWLGTSSKTEPKYPIENPVGRK